VKFNLSIEDANGGNVAFSSPLTLDELNTVMSSMILCGPTSFVVKQVLEDPPDQRGEIPQEKLLSDCKAFAAALTGFVELDDMRKGVEAGNIDPALYDMRLHDWFAGLVQRHAESKKARSMRPKSSY
jgi:hypothetical protein